MKARLRRFDGIYRCFLIRANPLTDARGRLLKWCGVNTDIEDIMSGAARDASRWWPSSPGGAIVDGRPAIAIIAGDHHLDPANQNTPEHFSATPEQGNAQATAATSHPDRHADTLTARL